MLQIMIETRLVNAESAKVKLAGRPIYHWLRALCHRIEMHNPAIGER